MWFFKDVDGEYIAGDDPQEITLAQAMMEIDKFPTQGEYPDGFLGFINANDQTIQFFREKVNVWLLDHPVLEDGEYAHSLQEYGLTIVRVKQIVEKFLEAENWADYCNLQQV